MWGWIKRHVGTTVVIAAVVVYLVYEVSTYILVYTDDAYVATDVVLVAPQVAGSLEALNVRRDQRVEAGDTLFLIDQEPFQIALQGATASLKAAEGEVVAAEDNLSGAQDSVKSATAIMQDAKLILDRQQELLSRGNASRQTVDNAQRDYSVAVAQVQDAKSAELVAQQQVKLHEAEVSIAKAKLAYAKWELEQTLVQAPSGGRIGPVTAQPGDYIDVGAPVLALITDNDWRIVANVRERFLESLEPGQFVWFNLASEPWVWRRGKVRSLAAGISRSPSPPEVLPFVDPITDWIRLPRRFPIEIDLLGLQQRRQLHQGADASVLVFF